MQRMPEYLQGSTTALETDFSRKPGLIDFCSKHHMFLALAV